MYQYSVKKGNFLFHLLKHKNSQKNHFSSPRSGLMPISFEGGLYPLIKVLPPGVADGGTYLGFLL
jgi:hypothetical protein